MRRLKIWDLPTRLFHWTLVGLLCLSWYTSDEWDKSLHMLSGYLILGLVVFRILWGLFGSETARLARLIPHPKSVASALGKLFRKTPDEEAGHSALGSLSVIVLLALVLIQAVTGLFSTDDIITDGPLVTLIGTKAAQTVTGIHELNFRFLQGFVALHILAVLFYTFFKGHRLVQAMIHGHKLLPEAITPPRITPWWWAVPCAALAAGLIWAVVNRAWTML